MGSCPSSLEIEGLLAGTLAAEHEARVRAHLEACERCRGHFESRQAHRPPYSKPPFVSPGETVSGPPTPRAVERSDAEDSPPWPKPESVEGYEILREIHRGGQGVVYKAVQLSTKRVVALKFLLGGQGSSAAQRHRFEREIDLVAGLRHPNIVTLYESGVREGRFYFAMEYIHGQPLDASLAKKRLVEETLRLMIKVCDAVSHAHQRGIIHRDLKPGNILVDPGGEPHVVDFGLAKAAGRDTLGSGAPVSITSEFMGTLAYASPEQTGSDPSFIDVRTDVYSLGVILYRMLTGCHPYDVSGSLRQTIKNISEAEPPKPSDLNDALTDDVDTIVLKALAKDRERRYQSAGLLGQELQRVLRGELIEAKRDSAMYVLRARSRALVRKRRVASFVGAVIVATLLARFIGVPLGSRWTGADRRFGTLVVGLTPMPYKTALDRVRVVALTDRTNVEELARRQELLGVGATNNKSLRRLHGRLMERLAMAGARVVVWDIAFRGKTEFDDDFVRGVRGLREAGVHVTVAVRAWWFDGRRPSDLSSVIAPEVRWGCTASNFESAAPWSIALVGRRGLANPLPSLALQAVNSARLPGAESSLSLDDDAVTVELAYWTPNPRLPYTKHWLGETDTIELAKIEDRKTAMPDLNLRRGDKVGTFVMMMMPPDRVLRESTIEYGEVLSAADEQLVEWLGDKVVVVADMRPGVDRHAHPGGRELPGCYGHAVAIDMLLKTISPPVRRWRVPIIMVALIGAVLGLVPALTASESLARRVLLSGISGALLVGLCILLGIGFHYFCSPLVPVVALVVGAELAALVRRVGRVQWSQAVERRI